MSDMMEEEEVFDGNDTEASEVTICGFYEGYNDFRFTLIFCASLIALTGIFSNSLLCWIFATRRYPSTPTLYLAVLAVLDVAICCVYILLFGVDSVSVYFSVKELFLLWHEYILPVFCVSRTVCQQWIFGARIYIHLAVIHLSVTSCAGL